MPGIYPEVWVKEVIKEFSHVDQDSWLKGIPDFSSKVSKVNTINLTELGVNPDVLINNTIYPIPSQALNANNIPIGLDKYQTKVTPLADDELKGLSYDKKKTTIEQHGTSIGEGKLDQSAFRVAPVSNSVKTPVIRTTGPDDGAGRKRLVKKDVVTLFTAFNKAKIPLKGRRLVLSLEHLGDLLTEDDRFQTSYTNIVTGVVNMLAGFDVHTFVNTPYYNQISGNKLSYGALPTADDRQASFAFLIKRMFKASGETKMYFKDAEPENQTATVNFRHYFITLPQNTSAIGAIY